jgi:hypothetical protein
MTANAVVARLATVLCSIPASSDKVESEGRQMKQCWIQYIKKVILHGEPFSNDPISAEWNSAAGTRLFGSLDRLPGADASEPRLLPRAPQFLLVRGRVRPGLSRLGPLLLWRLRKYLSGHAGSAAAATAAGREAFTKLWVSWPRNFLLFKHIRNAMFDQLRDILWTLLFLRKFYLRI